MPDTLPVTVALVAVVVVVTLLSVTVTAPPPEVALPVEPSAPRMLSNQLELEAVPLPPVVSLPALLPPAQWLHNNAPVIHIMCTPPALHSTRRKSSRMF
jgi:hypothetical protein